MAEASAMEPGASGGTLRGRLAGWALERRFEIGAVAVGVASCLAVLENSLHFPHPSGSDPGQWLQLSNAMLGIGETTLSPYQYPPGTMVVLAALRLLFGDPIVALYALLAMIAFLLPVTAYAAYTMLTNDRRAALIFALLIGFCQGFFDMTSWGAYPNLLSFCPLMLAFVFLVRAMKPAASRREFMLFGLFAGLVFLTHPLSAILLALGAMVYVGLVCLTRFDRRSIRGLALYATPVFVLLYGPYLTVRLISHVISPSYLTSTPVYSLAAAWYPLVPWRFKDAFPFTPSFTIPLTLLVAAITLVPLYRVLKNRRAPRILHLVGLGADEAHAIRLYFLFLAALLPPLLLPVTIAVAGFGTDYARATYFLYLPLAAGAAAVLSAAGRRGALPALLKRFPRIAARMSPKRPALRHASDWAGPALCAATVFLLVGTNLEYLDKSIAYYSRFDKPQDLELVSWLRDNTAPNDVQLLSPAEENQVSFNWVAGLSERRTLAYTQPAWLFYGAERTRNHEIFQMLGNRQAFGGRTLEASTQGIGDLADFQLRVTQLSRLAEFPTVQFKDFRTTVELANGSMVLASELEVRSARLALNRDGIPALQTRAADLAGQIELVRTATFSGDALSVEFMAFADGLPARSVRMWAIPSGPMCRAWADAGVITWDVRDGTGCVRLTARAVPSIDVSVSEDLMDLTLPLHADGTAVLVFEGEPADSGYTSELRFYDSASLFEHHSVDYVIASASDGRMAAYMMAEYHFPVVFQNAGYTVLSTHPSG